jgi:hypothetical protein
MGKPPFLGRTKVAFHVTAVELIVTQAIARLLGMSSNAANNRG